MLQWLFRSSMVQDSISLGHPTTGQWYGCATNAAASASSESMPPLLLSTEDRRSEYTTPRSDSIIFGSNARARMRSASMSNICSSMELGNQSVYTVTSLLVYALLLPPPASMVRSNCLGPYFFAPLNIMCSKKCETPVAPGCSLREPLLQK